MDTTTKCLTDDQLSYKARGGTLWKSEESHVATCEICSAKIQELEKEVAEHQKITTKWREKGTSTMF